MAGILGPLIFNQVYPATVDTEPGAILAVASGAAQMIYCDSM